MSSISDRSNLSLASSQVGVGQCRQCEYHATVHSLHTRDLSSSPLANVRYLARKLSLGLEHLRPHPGLCPAPVHIYVMEVGLSCQTPVVTKCPAQG